MRRIASPEILVIDDDGVDQEALRRHLVKAFGGETVNIHMCSTGKEGLELLQSRTFGCVFLDYLLPDMNGIALLRSVYDPKTDLANAPVVMLTGKGSEAIMIEALRQGAQDYIVKDNISVESLKIAIMKAKELFELKHSRYQAEEKLQHALKMEAVGQLTSGLAHDFNNLLTVVLGNVYLMQEIIESSGGTLDPARIQSEIAAIEAVARTGTEMVKRLLVFSRQAPLTNQKADANDCIRNAMALVRATLGEGVRIETLLAEGLPPISVDVSEFTNVLINLSVNARDAMPKGGTLTLETARVVLDEFYAANHPDVKTGKYVMLAVSDTGSGMDRDTVRRIFEPFFTTKPAGKGTGLGLAMVYGFIRQSGGHIDVYSERGHGTVFRLYLPEAEGAAENAPAAAAGAAGANAGEVILIAENDDNVRGTAVSMLEKLGYRTLQAKDGRAALELFKREQKDIALIFADICMSGDLDGIELVREARSVAPAIPAIFTSGYTEHTLRTGKLAPQDEFISKPYHADALARKIGGALRPGKSRHG